MDTRIINLPTGVKMFVKHQVSTNRLYLLFSVSGNYNFADTLNLVKYITKTCSEKKIFKVLIDMSKLKDSDMPDTDRFYIGEAISKNWINEMIGAVIYPPQSITGYVETVARNRYAQIRVFGDKEDALYWLLEKN